MLPQQIGRLEELANNLWWSWHPSARHLFRVLDYPLWRTSGHNPVKQLRETSPDRLQAIAADPEFLAEYNNVMSAFDTDVSGSNTWFAREHPDRMLQPIAFFSAEFALHNSLPIYAGGLGVLAGDICKEASDLGLPMVAVGFMYPQGYFHQRISAEGWQEESYRQLNFDEAPVNPVYTPQGQRCLAEVKLNDQIMHIGAWLVRVGRVNIYLLDTNMEENAPEMRGLSARLYTADREQRIQQEIVLGIGGVRVLRALGIKPSVWHANEGHTAFMMLERIREEVEQGTDFSQAVQKVQATTVFTTHTPVPAGHDIFSVELVDRYFHNYWASLDIDREAFLKLGGDGAGSGGFNMTALALRLSERRNAVSRIHGAVSRKMWHGLWSEVPEDKVPISHITNGVHLSTWLALEMGHLYEHYLGEDISARQDDAKLRDYVMNIPDEVIWDVRTQLKRKLIGAMVERSRQSWESGEATARQVVGMGALLNPGVLTIGFVRRFTEYKRPALILYDLERLRRIVKSQWQPIQIVFAGKSHPADTISKYLLQRVYSLATEPAFEGRIAFVEDYDMHMARYLVQGIDVWLNTPRRLQEASGTSGMKAAANGALNLSVPDGWWSEGYNGGNGWIIGTSDKDADPEIEDRADAEALYQLLENEIIPLYYQRDHRGIPHGWIHAIKESITSIVPVFCARRMLKEYTERMYLPAIHSQKTQTPEATTDC